MRRSLAVALLVLCSATPLFGGTILFLGDSLTAGLGVSEEQAYPALIQQKIREENLPFDVINAGVSGDTTAGGLARVDRVQAKNPAVKIVIAGMRMPPNLGGDYGSTFQEAFADLARKNDAALIPFLLDGVGGHIDLNQPDHIHPTAAGHRVVADNVWRVLEPLLKKD